MPIRQRILWINEKKKYTDIKRVYDHNKSTKLNWHWQQPLLPTRFYFLIIWVNNHKSKNADALPEALTQHPLSDNDQNKVDRSTLRGACSYILASRAVRVAGAWWHHRYGGSWRHRAFSKRGRQTKIVPAPLPTAAPRLVTDRISEQSGRHSAPAPISHASPTKTIHLQVQKSPVDRTNRRRCMRRCR